MKKIAAALIYAYFALCLTACTPRQEVARVTETTIPPATQAVIETMQSVAEQEMFSYDELRDHVFYFSSGVGGWFTELTIGSDGSFTGHFQDFNAEDGNGYQGVLYVSDFTGRFSQPVYVNDTTYGFRLEEVIWEKQGQEEILDGVLHCYGEGYGIVGGEEFYLYLPGAPLEELPQEYRSWVGYYDLTWTEDTQLPFYGLYNANQQCGFSSYDMVQNVRDAVSSAEEQDASLQQEIQENPHATQADMNVAASSRYEIWDSVLNHLWGVLKKRLDPAVMRELTQEELAWIQEKEVAVVEAGKEVEGGSLYPLVTGSKAADLTKQRVYELLKYLK